MIVLTEAQVRELLRPGTFVMLPPEHGSPARGHMAPGGEDRLVRALLAAAAERA